MSINNLRKKISELAICDDINLVDSLIGIGTDRKVYKVNKEKISDGGKWIPLTATISSSGGEVLPMDNGGATPTEINVQLVQSEIEEAYKTGGKIHVIVYYNDIGNIYNDIQFLISPSYMLPVLSDISSGVLARKITIPYMNEIGKIVISGTLYPESLSLESLDIISGDGIPFEFKGIFFEPIENIGDLSKVSEETSSGDK